MGRKNHQVINTCLLWKETVSTEYVKYKVNMTILGCVSLTNSLTFIHCRPFLPGLFSERRVFPSWYFPPLLSIFHWLCFYRVEWEVSRKKQGRRGNVKGPSAGSQLPVRWLMPLRRSAGQGLRAGGETRARCFWGVPVGAHVPCPCLWHSRGHLSLSSPRRALSVSFIFCVPHFAPSLIS